MVDIEDMYDGSESYSPPVSRWEVFKSIFKNSPGTLINVSLLTFLFALPLYIWIVISILAINSLGNGYDMVNEAVKQQILINAFWTKVIMCAVSVPLSLLFSIGLAGANYVVRKLVWDEGFMLMTAYKNGIKNNVKNYMLSTLMTTVILSVCYIGYSYIMINPLAASWQKALSIIGLTALALFSVSAQMFIYTQSVIYELPLPKIIKNAAIFSLVLAPKNIGVMLITIIPAAAIFVIPHILYQIIGGALLAIIGLSYIVLTITLYSHSVYDRYINEKNHSDIFEKGLIHKEKPQLED